MRGQLVGTGVDNGAPPPSSPPPRPPDPPWTGTPARQRPWTGGTGPGPAGRVLRAARLPFAVTLCLVLGAGLLGAAGIGALASLLSSDRHGAASPAENYAEARALWHTEPVDAVFPPTIKASGAGPGKANRTWTRVGVAPDSGCHGAFDPPLATALVPAGCLRLLRATYADATSTDVTTVGVLVTGADPAGMTALRRRLGHAGLSADPRAMPLPVAFPGTAAAHFGAAQRGSWTVAASRTLPIVVYAVSGFADGRALDHPSAAAAATVRGATSVAAQAGLGYEADGLADAVEHRYQTAVRTALGGGPHSGDAS